jgi:hypothetical protein
MVDQRSVWVFALTARELWKPFTLPEQCLHWYNSAKKHSMISLPGILWGCVGSLDILVYEEMKSLTSSQEMVLFQSLVGPEPSLGVSRQNIRRKIKWWMDNQHLARWQDFGSSQRQARRLISGPSLDTKIRHLSYDRIQSRVVIGLLSGHSTLRRHLHSVGLPNCPLYRRCGAEDNTSAHILCECEA